MSSCARGTLRLCVAFFVLVGTRPGLANNAKPTVYDPARGGNYSLGERTEVLKYKGQNRVKAHNGIWNMWRVLGTRRLLRTTIRGWELTSKNDYRRGAAQLFDWASKLDFKNGNQLIREHGEGQASAAVHRGVGRAKMAIRALTFWEAVAAVAPKVVKFDFSVVRNTLDKIHDKIPLPAIDPAMVDQWLPVAVAGLAVASTAQAAHSFYRAGRHEVIGVASVLQATKQLEQLVKDPSAPDAAPAILTAIAKERKQVKRGTILRKRIPLISSESVVNVGTRRHLSSKWLAELDKLEAEVKSFQNQ